VGVLMVDKKEQKVPEIQQSVNWIELECVDDDGNPLANVDYILFLFVGNEKTGTLDNQGYTKVENVPPGECKLMLLGYESSK
jgi:hypothetical protein